MAKKNIEEKEEYSKESATVEELFQECPKCKGDLLIKVQTDKEFQYKCDDCGYQETRKRK